MLNQSGLSAGQIEAVMKLYEDASCKLMDKFLTLPHEKLQSLLNALKKRNQLSKDLFKPAEQLRKILKEAFQSLTPEQHKILKEAFQSLKEDGQMELEENVHQPIFKKLVEAFQELREEDKAYIHPGHNQQLKAVDRGYVDSVCEIKLMEALFLASSPEAQQACQPHLNDWLSVSKNLLQEEKTIRQIMPHALVEEIQSIGREVSKQEAAIQGKQEAIIRKQP